jgi:hypothetical protein
MDVSRIVTISSVFGAVVILAGFAWAFGDDSGYRPIIKREFERFLGVEFKLAMDQTEQNTLAIARQEFNYIEEKKLRGGLLTYEEKRDFCKNAQILQYPVEGCALDTGEPIFTKRSKVK